MGLSSTKMIDDHLFVPSKRGDSCDWSTFPEDGPWTVCDYPRSDHEPRHDYCSCCRPASERSPAKMTWRCDHCEAEFDWLTYGGPCPENGCTGELQRHRRPGLQLAREQIERAGGVQGWP